MTIGFLGLGTMGAAMVRRLLATGHDVVVWNRTASAAEPLVVAGARMAVSPEEAIATGTFLSMLANDAANEVVFDAAALAAAPAGSLHVDHSTVSVAEAQRLADRHAAAGVGYVAAPVLGRSPLAEQGLLNVVAAGAAADVERARPVLDAIGKRTWVVGERPEQASLVKIAVNYNLIHTLQALAESIALVENAGVSGSDLVEILTDAAYTGTAYQGYGPLIAERRYAPPGFTVELGAKDLGLAADAAARFGVELPTAPVLRELFQEALADQGLAHLDWSAVAEITRRRAHR